VNDMLIRRTGTECPSAVGGESIKFSNHGCLPTGVGSCFAIAGGFRFIEDRGIVKKRVSRVVKFEARKRSGLEGACVRSSCHGVRRRLDQWRSGKWLINDGIR